MIIFVNKLSLMRNFLISLFIFLSFCLQGQTANFINVVNIYRAKNGLASLAVSENLNKIANGQTALITTTDKVCHSNWGYEILNSGKNLPGFGNSLIEFKKFLIDVWGIEWKCPKNESEVATLLDYYVIFLFHQYSPKHKDILLGDFTKCGFRVVHRNLQINPLDPDFKSIQCDCNLEFVCVITFEK